MSNQNPAIAIVAEIYDVERSFLGLCHKRVMLIKTHMCQSGPGVCVLGIEDDQPLCFARSK